MKALKTSWNFGQQAIAYALFIAIASAQAGNAAPQGDVFARSTKKGSVSHSSVSHAKATTQAITTPTQWFEAIDEAVVKLRPTAADDAILSRPFNQNPERVEQWSEVAAKVAKNYRHLARTIKNLKVPRGMNDVKEYCVLSADWYDDAALVFEDMIRPRPPANTMEELQAQLTEIQDRANALAKSNTQLADLDKSLRKTYRVHKATYDDPLTQYVSRK